jgi:D-alanine-D-alanine ligase
VSDRLRVVVLAGGRSSEREISFASARSVAAALDPERYEVLPVAIGVDGAWRLLSGIAELGDPGAVSSAVATALVPGTSALATQRDGGAPALAAVDVVFPVLHGPFGEDGTIQGLLETIGLPYVGSGVLGSSVSMDKDLCKNVLRGAGIAVAPSLTLRDGRDDPDDPALPGRVGQALGWPVFVKPASLGSSVGISRVPAGDELADALRLGFAHDEKVLVETAMDGRELECGVLGNTDPIASAIAEIVPRAGDWYDYAAKYEVGGSEIVIPAELAPSEAARIRETALAAFRACECSGMARIDFFLRPSGELVLNEVNTIPGFTDTSVYARLVEAQGLPYAALLDRLIELALERHTRRARYRY